MFNEESFDIAFFEQHLTEEKVQQAIIACSETLLISLLHEHFTMRIKALEKQGWDSHRKGIAIPDCIQHATADAHAALEMIELFRQDVVKEDGGKKERAPRMKKTKGKERASSKRRHEDDSDYCECHVSANKQTTGTTPPAPLTSF